MVTLIREKYIWVLPTQNLWVGNSTEAKQMLFFLFQVSQSIALIFTLIKMCWCQISSSPRLFISFYNIQIIVTEQFCVDGFGSSSGNRSTEEQHKENRWSSFPHPCVILNMSIFLLCVKLEELWLEKNDSNIIPWIPS